MFTSGLCINTRETRYKNKTKSQTWSFDVYIARFRKHNKFVRMMIFSAGKIKYEYYMLVPGAVDNILCVLCVYMNTRFARYKNERII